MDWAGWALFGLVATSALTGVMIAAQLAGLTRLDLPLMLGTLVTEDPDHARVAGFFMHLLSERKLIYGILILTVVFFAVLLWGPAHDIADKFHY